LGQCGDGKRLWRTQTGDEETWTVG
jgi:hypothetical protein